MTAPRPVPRQDEIGHHSALADRRRSPRRRLHQPGEVVLRGIGPRDAWTDSGILLNASGDGIACRLSAQTAQPLIIGQTLRVAFRVESSLTVFELQARISNITPAATSDTVVLGMEFVADPRLERLRAELLESLRRAGDEES